MTNAPTTWALIPIKARGQGKTRLAGALSPCEREGLVEAMLAHVVGVAEGVVARVMLVGPERAGVGAGLERIGDAGGGLNAALEQALAEIAGRGDAPARLIFLPADLPCVSAAEIEKLAQLPPGTVGIAPDRHGRGTNALSLPLPEAAGWRFHFGSDSAALHRTAAEILGLNAVTITGPGLEKDIDEPGDLADAGHLFSLST
ncbi:2-phospho-L-lactate guanylyltransferase [Novosphingobium sp. AP12]|uniref:2-phospho-L-lactate guanylyltransferase n=1 Tax=Novosphingobium sp. AP12 TaxID=1144305 RepID=UPI000271FB3D|nr:2-phospho-L-lactate guanylyltransferase [Novosphingobium sp. AP12]EJL28740.1 2-phospho-L-lactate guanylyltransferase [Novosphingobium sp. AP12]